MRGAAAGKTLLPSRATAARWGKKVRDGAPLEPLPSGPRKGSGKPEPFVAFFVELIGQDPDITLVELQAVLLAAHGVSFSTSGIDALLRRHGYTYKKVLIPELDPGSVVILDNLATHKSDTAARRSRPMAAGFCSCPPAALI